MRIDGIHIKNFLSFDDFSWSGLDPHLNVIIGPNGAGKTNLFHALRVVADYFALQRTGTTQVWAGATHRQTGSRAIEIALDLEFTGAWERQLLCRFFAAALFDDQVIQQYVQSQPNIGRGLDWQAAAKYVSHIIMTMRPEALAWLYEGRLVVAFDGMQWQAWYEARPGAAIPFHLSFGDSRGTSVLLGTSRALTTNTILAAWFTSPPENTTGAEDITPDERAARSSRNDALITFLTTPPSGDSPAPPADIYPPLDTLPALVSYLSGVGIRVQRSQYASLATQQALEEVSGVRLERSRFYDARWLFGLLLEHSLVFTDNLRLLPRDSFAPDELTAPEVDLRSGEDLALLLFQLKNGFTDEQTSRYDRIRGLFQTLTGRIVDVGLYPSARPDASLVSRTEGAAQPPGRIELNVTTRTPWGAAPLEYSGAGVVEALLLSAIIEGADHRVVLLDEPASNLHPQVQTSLLAEIRRRQDNQFVVITHSPSLILPEGLTQVSRLHVSDGRSVRVSLDLSQMDAEQADKIRKELRRSTDLRALLFSRGVILTEGDTELGAFPVWFEAAGFSLPEHDIALYTVDGDTRFPIPVLLLREFAIPWAIVCDGKVIGDMVPPRIVKYLASAKVPNLPDTTGLDFTQTRDTLRQVGVFSLANGPTDEFEALPVISNNVVQAGKQVGSSKPRRGRYIAEHYPPPKEVADLLDLLKAHLGF